MQGFDPSGGYPPAAHDAPASITLPAEWLRDYPGLLARLCIVRCQHRRGGRVPTPGQVMQEAARILPGYALSRSAAKRAFKKSWAANEPLTAETP